MRRGAWCRVIERLSGLQDGSWPGCFTCWRFRGRFSSFRGHQSTAASEVIGSVSSDSAGVEYHFLLCTPAVFRGGPKEEVHVQQLGRLQKHLNVSNMNAGPMSVAQCLQRAQLLCLAGPTWGEGACTGWCWCWQKLAVPGRSSKRACIGLEITERSHQHWTREHWPGQGDAPDIEVRRRPACDHGIYNSRSSSIKRAGPTHLY